MPTLDEINSISPDTPVFILHLYMIVPFMNRAALKAVGYTKDTQAPPGGAHRKRCQRRTDRHYHGYTKRHDLVYATLGKGPKLSYEHQVNSTRHYMTEMNRFGITSVIDAGWWFPELPG
jgi:predicted amidohydrolase YtcJ